jgi:DNA-binding IclR family transcriptional regulator
VRAAEPASLDRNSVLGKVADLLAAFRTDDDYLALAEIARRTGLAKASTHRLLSQLVVLRWVERRGDSYRLGGGLFELGMRASVERGLLEHSIPYLQDLYERTHECVHLGVRDGVEVIYIAKLGGHRQVPSPSRVGGRMPLHCTAIGKALLAYAPADVLNARVKAGLVRVTPRTVIAPGVLKRQLARVVDSGVAVEHEESAVGVACVAATVFDSHDQPVAAVSITGPSNRFRPQDHANSVRAAAAGITATLARSAARNL